MFIDLNYEPKFPTDCFFMTIHAIHIGINAVVQSIRKVQRHLHQIQIVMKETEEEIKKANGSRQMRLMEKLKNQKVTNDVSYRNAADFD